jgi:ornithine cyclodeaminase
MPDPTIFDAQATAERLPFGALIDALEDGFSKGCQAPVRHHHTMSRRNEPDATLLLMPAWSNPEDARQYLGIKLVTVVPGNTARKLPGLESTYVLYDGVTGQQLALMDGNTITGRRTVATSALAARHLSREDSSRLLVLGSGRIAGLIPEAYRAVRPIEEVTVWNVNEASARRLVDRLSDQGFRARVAANLEDAVRAADIVSAATLSTEPLVRGDWLRPGTHLDLIGAFRPNMREADDRAAQVGMVYVDTDEALHEAGDLVQPLRAKAIQESDVRGTLAQLARQEVRGREAPEQITYFKAVGSALADLVAARLVYEADSVSR